MKTINPVDHSVIQDDRVDEAIQRVQDELTKRGKPFSDHIKAILPYNSKQSLRNVAKEADVPIRTLINWMQYGSRDFSRLARICKILDVDANYLLGLTSERKTLSEIKLSEAFNEHVVSSCPSCGTTEMLCGHGGVGCTSER